MLSTRPISLNSDIDVAGHSALSTKTPGRKASKSRNGLQENAVHTVGPKTVFKKSALQTPFRPGTAHGKKPLISISAARPLMDKTPFPNRVAAVNFGGAGKTPGPQGLKLSKLALLAPAPEQDSSSPDIASLRPSSTRKSLRGRLSGTFKTPLTKGNYWDVSPGDMEGINNDVAEQAQEAVETAVDDEDDELEYMPPGAVECPYVPPFDMPNYKVLGSSLFELGHGDVMDDTASQFYAQDIHHQIDVDQLLLQSGYRPDPSALDTLEIPVLEDDNPFTEKPPNHTLTPPATKPSAPLARAGSARTVPTHSAIPSRPAGASSRPTASSSRIPAPAPVQTRTSALRAAKAAASSSAATTPIPSRPATSAGSRVVSKPSLNSAAPSAARPRPASAAAAATQRPRAATVTGKARAPSTAGAPKSKASDDGFAGMLEKHFVGSTEDFAFDV